MGNRSTGGVFVDVMERLSTVEPDVWQSNFDVLDEEGVFRLLVYHPIEEREHKNPLLIVYAFINRPYVLDLHPDVSVVRKYLQAGFSVYMIDWGYPTKVDKYLKIDDYVDYVERCVEIIKERQGIDKVSLHGYCLGGCLSLIYTALHQENVQNLMLQATPVDFYTDNTIALWARSLNPDKIVNTSQAAPGDFLNIGFLLVDPINLMMGKYHGLFETLEEEGSATNFLRMEKWIFDSPDVPAETYKQYIKEWYQQNLLIKNQFKSQGEVVDLSKIEVPVLVLAAAYDHIVPPESQKAILGAISSKDKDVYETKKGHIGITVSGTCHKEFWPEVVEWLKQRSEKV